MADQPILLKPNLPCPHKRMRVYVEKRDGKLLPGILRCWDCGEELKRRIVLVNPNDAAAMAAIPQGAHIVSGSISGVSSKKK